MHFALHHAHAWDVTPKEAVALQRDLADRVRETPLDGPVETIAGIDVSVRKDDAGTPFAQAAIAVLRLDDLTRIDEAIHRDVVPFPYVPGLLSFREVPVILPALEQLTVRPDVLMTD
ncbi:MAG: endonuclease V, partial [Bacteroidetes bacterium]|nr:endonuclease V [Bacteroidota bacterium]